MLSNKQKAYYAKLFRMGGNGDLNRVYKSCSYAKLSSYERIRYEMEQMGGWGLTVLTHNSNFYTCAYAFTDEETGEVMIMIHTPTYYAIVPYSYGE